MDERTRLQELALSERGFLFDPFSGQSFSLNPTARAMIDALRRGQRDEELIAALRRDFDVSELDDPARDLQDFLRSLREHGLLPREAP